jgi:hypothetical protein
LQIISGVKIAILRCFLLEVKINREIRDYSEQVYFGFGYDYLLYDKKRILINFMYNYDIESLNKRIEEKNEKIQVEKRTYTISEIQDILGISQPTAYGLIKKHK